ncbi:MAG: MFS transporter [Kiloniellales bacterium]|nr:MFS transporter [Kiloniellales bacterium]
MHVRYPVWLRFVGRPGAAVFAGLFALESFSRALLSTVITLQAITLFETTRGVSLIFSLVGVTALIASFAIPGLVRRLSRRWVYSLGAGLLIVAAGLLATITVGGQVSGMLVRVFGAACLSITASLYIMQYINKRDLTHSEPMRLQFSALAWTAGPWLGVWLTETYGAAAAYSASALAAVALLVVFWTLRLSDNPAVGPAAKPPPSPLKSIGRFAAQPRLRLAWTITFARSCWWVFFFIYAPVYMIQAGHSGEAGALLVSAGNAMLFLTPAFGGLARRYSVRRVLAVAFLALGATTALAGVFFASSGLVIVFLLAGSLACVALDSVGNIPFIRSVHPYERPQMTTVFRTYIDASELATPAVFALVLTLWDLQGVFVVCGLAMAAFAYWPRFLPRRM